MKRGYSQKSIIITSPVFSKYIFFKLLYTLKDMLITNNEISYTHLERLYKVYNGGSGVGVNGAIDYLTNSVNTDFLLKEEVKENGKVVDCKETNEEKESTAKEQSDYNIVRENIILSQIPQSSSAVSELSEEDNAEISTSKSDDNKDDSFSKDKVLTLSTQKYNSFRDKADFIQQRLNSDQDSKTDSITTEISHKSNNTSNKDSENNRSSHCNFYHFNFSWKETLLLSRQEIQFNNFFEVFSLFYVAKLWQIWELIILEYPIVVFSDDASRVSNIVFLLESLTHPLPLSSDIRPYFSIYDPDFKEYKEEESLKQHNSTILGVINPIFMKLAPDWPVILRFDEHFFNNDLRKKVPESPIKEPLSSSITDYYDSKINKSSTLYEVKKYMKKPRNFALKGHSQLISLFLDCLKSQGEDCYGKLNHHLRAHFSELTRDFIKTIEDFVLLNEVREIKRITLQKKNFSIFEIFNKEKFLMYLKEKVDKNAFYYKYVHDKKKLVNLYSEFLKTKCFRNHLKYLLDQIRNE
eukprot:CAMPEP_0170516118 /NCGR_PEP_ID=MMETSP0209-20121228/2439_1 /TAXON_ID=665100 ORGANISM="Litonotus pictus, Strain P1" /NCGR_SAMPLE_ID=MMETSP0209 /ASSEMBLY_ACC=CAM_ASM_000301 /LENGTH=522 /DNA_ID=CAMNT_0010800905 /DNA_START=424 /DNA_END=1992 /DNA_ORIENTATION=+